MRGIKDYLRTKDDIQNLVSGVHNNLQEQLVAGLTGSARSILAASLYEATNRPILLLTHQLIHAERLYEDLLTLVDEEEVHLYPVNELLLSEMAIASPELRYERIQALTNWKKQETGIMIVPVAALKRILPPPTSWVENQLTFTEGEDIQVEEQLLTLVKMGYERTELVTSPGEFSQRGGIVDIFPVTEEHPIRIDLFDTEIDSIRYFDPENQRSLEMIDHIHISPATELLLSKEERVAAADKLETSLANTLKKLPASQNEEQLIENIQADIEQLKSEESFEQMYKYMNFYYEKPASLLDYVPEEGLILLDELSRIQETAKNLDEEEAEHVTNLLEMNQMIKDAELSFNWSTIWTGLANKQRIYFSMFLRHITNTQPQNVINISSRAMQEFHGQMNLFKNELKRWKENDFTTIIFTPNEKRAERVQSIFRDYDIDSVIKDKVDFSEKTPMIVVGDIHQGIEFPLYQLAILTENELFKKQVRRTRRRQQFSNAERIKSYQELKVGDYVVHQSHGIGRYVGIETVVVNKTHKDYMLIKYAGDDKLYVPVEQIDLVQKFVGSEGKRPRLYKLGGTEWTRVKSRVQSSVEDIADDLIELYAERQSQKGFAFSPDSPMQKEFEASFPYRETEDQLRCVEEIKKDMESEQPMDRLLCGDVGYGKTEVAIRAAFKAILDGKQVALLVPTTILAQQHFQTITERFQDYAINIGLLSRFRTQKQLKETKEGLHKGQIDIVIGTHRLLSKDIKFHDLGLLIVDEEQRFGVKHKERIKQLKTNVDVLTLTATPIPRTLHMSLLGVRDLSVIETPPENRFPVQTYVVESSPILIKEAIEREMSRGGQVYYLHNRVDSIDKKARDIAEIVPDARIAVAHGQMNESQLEHVMMSFLEGEYDVLVSTTIIESGVDIPNVNTLIVANADHMGLSQLYQLRGRVGRSNRIAYAHFTYEKDKILTEIAEKRLNAIKEFTELGSGFKIAMRDLSIRGAGNLLGAEQHGFIDSVGFDMYSQMLKEAIDARKKGKEVEEVVPFDPEISVSLDAYIPSFYIDDEIQKIEMYKRFHTIETRDDIIDLRDELIDRFGEYPREVENLLTVSTLRAYAKRERVESIMEYPRKIELVLEAERSQKVDGSKLFNVANEFGRSILLGTDQNQLKATIRWNKESEHQRYEITEQFIDKLKDVNRTS
ncbi:MAG TPA: transcription-repair coupling factor [Bacillota bacterium]|nr:transcription-repair coupling factor [Bacillota bacterium]